MDVIRIQILTNKDERRDTLVQKLKSIDYVRIEKPISAEGDDVVKQFESDRSDVVLISEQYLGNGYKVSEKITDAYPQKTVLLIKGTQSKANARDILASGASDIIPFDVSTQYLTDIIYSTHKANLNRQQAIIDAKTNQFHQEGKIFTVFSTKGGSGKTFVATNLAVALAKEPDKRVVLVDFDLDYGGASLALNLKPTTSIGNAIEDISHLDSDLMESYLISHSSGLKVLPSDGEPRADDFVNAEQIGIILQTLRQTFDYIVIDMPNRFVENLNPAFGLATTVLLVTTPEVLNLKNARSALIVFKELNYPTNKIKVVLNKTSNGGINRKDVEATLEHDVSIEIPEDVKRVRKSQNEGVPYIMTYPRSPIARSVNLTMNMIVPQLDKKKRTR